MCSFGPINISGANDSGFESQNTIGSMAVDYNRINRMFDEIMLPSLRPVTGYIVGEMKIRSGPESQRQFIDLTLL